MYTYINDKGYHMYDIRENKMRLISIKAKDKQKLLFRSLCSVNTIKVDQDLSKYSDIGKISRRDLVNYTHFIFGGEVDVQDGAGNKRRIATNDLIIIDQEAVVTDYFV